MSQIPERSGLPSAVRGAGATMSTRPSAVRGAEADLTAGHWARSVVGSSSAVSQITVLMRPILTGEHPPWECSPALSNYSAAGSAAAIAVAAALHAG